MKKNNIEEMEKFEFDLFIFWIKSGFILLLLMIILSPICDYLKCKYSYTNIEYNIIAGCKIKYNGEYIIEELYKKTFEQNLNIYKK